MGYGFWEWRGCCGRGWGFDGFDGGYDGFWWGLVDGFERGDVLRGGVRIGKEKGGE